MKKIELRFLSKKEYDINVGRPGGQIQIKNGKLIRPAQDCSKKYGQSIILYQIDNLNNNGLFIEHEVGTITVQKYNLENCYDRVHQLTYDNNFELIDVFKERLDILHGFKIYLRSRRK